MNVHVGIPCSPLPVIYPYAKLDQATYYRLRMWLVLEGRKALIGVTKWLQKTVLKVFLSSLHKPSSYMCRGVRMKGRRNSSASIQNSLPSRTMRKLSKDKGRAKSQTFMVTIQRVSCFQRFVLIRISAAKCKPLLLLDKSSPPVFPRNR
jgi:hypothetical protein